MLPAGVMTRKRRKLVMKADLDIPHNRVPFNGEFANDVKAAEFVRDMTHELRTPLNAIIGLCQCLERDRDAPLNERQRDTVLRMERNAHALRESVNRLLEKMRNGESHH